MRAIPTLKFRKSLFRSAVLAFVLGVSFSALASETEINFITLPSPHKVEQANATEVLLSGNYDEIEKRLSESVSLEKRLSSGRPLFGAFHRGVSGCFLAECKSNPDNPKWSEARDHIDKWLLKYPDSVYAKTADAIYDNNLAWAIRGVGYSSEVNEDAWEIFAKLNASSFEKMLKIEEAGKSNPFWYYSFLYLSRDMREPREKIESLYYEAYKKFPEYYGLHFFWVGYNSRQWGGSLEQLSREIDKITGSIGGDAGKVLYARMWRAGYSQIKKDGEYFDFKKLRDGMDIIIKDYPDPYNLNKYAMIACRFQYFKTADRILSLIGDDLMLTVWKKQKYYDRCKQDVEISKQSPKAIMFGKKVWR